MASSQQKQSQTKCSNCDSLTTVIDSQQGKVKLLESRLKDVLRAYKTVCKEKDELVAINANISVNSNAQPGQIRMAQLEESIVNMSNLHAKLEQESKLKDEQIERLMRECNSLRQTSGLPNVEQRKTQETSQNKDSVKREHKHVQTDPVETPKPKLVDSYSQTDHFVPDSKWSEPLKTMSNSPDTAVVIPFQQETSSQEIPDSVSVGSSLDDDLPIGSRDSPAGHSSASNMHNNASLFYINELARKEIELADYKIRIREYECSLRELQWKYTNDKYK